jgi:hypothetical protein
MFGRLSAVSRLIHRCSSSDKRFVCQSGCMLRGTGGLDGMLIGDRLRRSDCPQRPETVVESLTGVDAEQHTHR